MPVEQSFNNKKVQFHLEIENKISNKKTTENFKELAIKYTENYLEALSIAENIYGVTVTQEEVTKYIDDHVAPIVLEEKDVYAKSLGLTVYELDYYFDRDIYVMDTLWVKLILVLMEKHPKKDVENNNTYQERIKKEFYSYSK